MSNTTPVRERLMTLESQLRTQRRIAWGAIALCTVSWLSSAVAPPQEAPNVLRARRLEIVDEHGGVLFHVGPRGTAATRAGEVEVVLGEPDVSGGLVLSRDGIRTTRGFTFTSAYPESAPFLEVDVTNHRLLLHGHSNEGSVGAGLGTLGADHLHLSSDEGDTFRVMPLGGGGAECEIGDNGDHASIVLKTIGTSGDTRSGDIQVFQGNERRLWLTSWEDAGQVVLSASGRARSLRVDDR